MPTPITLQRRHFEFIAGVIRNLNKVPPFGHSNAEEAERIRVAVHFADAVSPTNPNFNRARFLEACGV